MAAKLAPLRPVKLTKSISNEDCVDCEVDEDQDEEKEGKNEDDEENDEKAPIESPSVSSTSILEEKKVFLLKLNQNNNNNNSNSLNNLEQKSFQTSTQPNTNGASDKINALLEPMEGLPLNEQADHFGNFATTILESTTTHDVMSLEMNQMGGGYLDPNSFGGSSVDYDDFGQQTSLVYDVTTCSNKLSSPVMEHQHIEKSNDVGPSITSTATNAGNPESKPNLMRFDLHQMTSHHHPHLMNQRTFVPQYPVKTLDPLTYNQGLRNGALSSPINNSKTSARKSGNSRTTGHKKQEPIDPQRVEFEVQRNVSQILSATKQQKIAAEAQQKVISPSISSPIKPNFICPNCNKHLTNSRSLQRHRHNCMNRIGSPNSNNPMPPPMTPSQMSTAASSPLPAHFQMTPTHSNMFNNQGQNNQIYMSNSFDYKGHDDLTYSDWSRSGTYSEPQSVVGGGGEADLNDGIGFNNQSIEQKQEERSYELNTTKMRRESELGVPLSLDVDEAVAHSSSASLSSNSQGTPQSYQCESCKKAVSSARSLKRHHTTCKLYINEYGVAQEDSKAKSNRTRKSEKVKENWEKSVKKEKSKKSALLEILNSDLKEETKCEGSNSYEYLPTNDNYSTMIKGKKEEEEEEEEEAEKGRKGQESSLSLLSQSNQSNYYGSTYQYFPQQQLTSFQNVEPVECRKTNGPLPSINSSSWFSSNPSDALIKHSNYLKPLKNEPHKIEMKNKINHESMNCDCGNHSNEFDGGIPKTGLAINTCEDCSRQLCSASNLKRHRATCKAAIQRLCGSTPTSQPSTPIAPKTPPSLSTISKRKIPTPKPGSTNGGHSSAICTNSTISTTATVTYTKVNGLNATPSWNLNVVDKNVTAQTLKKNVSNSSLATISADQKTYISVGEHLRAQHVQQQKMLEAEKVYHHYQQSPQKPALQKYATGGSMMFSSESTPSTLSHHQHPALPTHQTQQIPGNKFGVVEHQHNESVHITSHPLIPERQSFVSSFSDFGSEDDELDDIDMDAFDEEMQKGAEIFHQQQEAQIKERAEADEKRMKTTNSDDYSTTTRMSTKLATTTTSQNHQSFPDQQNAFQSINQCSNFNPISSNPPTSFSKRKDFGKREKGQQIIKQIDASTKIEVSADLSSSPLDSIITSEPLPNNSKINGDKKIFQQSSAHSFETTPIDASSPSPSLQKIKKPQQEYQCPECLKTYSCRKNVKRHRMAVHKLTAEEIAKNPAIVSDDSLWSLINSEKANSISMSARRHTVAGIATSLNEMTTKSIGMKFDQNDLKTGNHQIETSSIQHKQSLDSNILSQRNQSIMQIPSPHLSYQNSQMISPRLSSESILTSSSSSWTTPASTLSWRRTRSGEYVDDEESKETARIAAELKRSAEEELAGIEGKKSRTELAEADTTFNEDNEKMHFVNLPPLSTSSSLGLPSLSSPNNDQSMGPPVAQQQNQYHHQPSSMYQPIQNGMASSLPSIGGWMDYDRTSNYPSQQMIYQVQHQPPHLHNQNDPSSQYILQHRSITHQQQQQQQQRNQSINHNQMQSLTNHINQNDHQSINQHPSLPQTPINESSQINNEGEVRIKKKKTHICTGCQKVLSSDYSLRRHRSTCAEVKSIQATKSGKSGGLSHEGKKMILSKKASVDKDETTKSGTSSPTLSNQQQKQQQQQQQEQQRLMTKLPTSLENKSSPIMKTNEKPQYNGGANNSEQNDKINGMNDAPDSTTCQRHDRSTSPGINGLTNDVDFSTGNDIKSESKTNQQAENQRDLSDAYKNDSENGVKSEILNTPDEVVLIFTNNNNTNFKISKSLLSNSSPYFAHHVQSYDPTKGGIHLADCELNNFQMILDILSHRTIVNENNIDIVVELSKRFQFITVVEAAENFISDVLPKISIMHAIRLAEKHKMALIKSKLFDSISIDVFRSLSSDQNYRMMDANLKAELLEKWGTFL